MNKLDTVVLDNGLKIYLYRDLRRHSTFFQFTTFCGGITKHFKYKGKTYNISDGVSHILEHYLVECNELGNFLDILGERQMSTNASTSPYCTSYYFETVQDISFGIDTILKGVYNIKFDKDKLESLKNPIKQEVRGRFDNKFYHLGRLRNKNLFKNIDYIDVGGTIDNISNTTIKDLELLYKAFYRPDNQFIVVAGNFDINEVVDKIKEFYKDLVFEDNKTELIPYNEDVYVPVREDVLDFPTPMDYLDISFKINISKYSNTELLDLDFYINTFLDSSFGIASNLHKKLVDNKIIYDGISFSNYFVDKYLIISIGAYALDVDVFKNNVLDLFKNMNEFDEDFFETTKKSSIVKLILRDENIFKMVSPLINNIIYYNYPYLDEVEDVQKLTYDEYVSAIKDIDYSNYTITHIKNKE